MTNVNVVRLFKEYDATDIFEEGIVFEEKKMEDLGRIDNNGEHEITCINTIWSKDTI